MMPTGLNQMTMAHAAPIAVMDAAAEIGCVGIELRNDLEAGLFGGMSAADIGQAASQRNLRILALAEVYGFNDNTALSRELATELAASARECRAEAIVLIPRVDDKPSDRATHREKLRAALEPLVPICTTAGVTALIEPLGFANSSLRYKADVMDVLQDMGNPGCFGLIHDTFHHTLAGETEFFAHATQMVHISGVTDQTVPLSNLTDAHRVVVGPQDRLENIKQIKTLQTSGYTGPFSFEVFDPAFHTSEKQSEALIASTAFITSHLADRAA